MCHISKKKISNNYVTIHVFTCMKQLAVTHLKTSSCEITRLFIDFCCPLSLPLSPAHYFHFFLSHSISFSLFLSLSLSAVKSLVIALNDASHVVICII